VLALNVRGQLSRGVAELAQAAAGQDVLVFTETWLGEGQQAPDIAGFRAVQYNRPRALLSGQARGGLACYFRNELFAHVTHISGDATNSFAVLKVSKDVGFDQDLYLVVCYVPPMQSNSISMATRGIWAQLQQNVTSAIVDGLCCVWATLTPGQGT